MGKLLYLFNKCLYTLARLCGNDKALRCGRFGDKSVRLIALIINKKRGLICRTEIGDKLCADLTLRIRFRVGGVYNNKKSIRILDLVKRGAESL